MFRNASDVGNDGHWWGWSEIVLPSYRRYQRVKNGPVKPNIIMQELGYEALKIAQGTDSIFFEVTNVIRPLHSFLEESEILDGRFDPRETASIKNLDHVVTGACSAFPCHQDASGPVLVSNESCEPISPAMDPETKRESIQRTKVKRSTNFRK